MIQELKKRIQELEQDVKNLGELLKVEDKRKAVSLLQLKMSEPGFWNDPKAAALVVSELKCLKSDVDEWDDLYAKLRDVSELIAICDADSLSEISSDFDKIKSDYERLRLRILFSGKFDNANVIVEINAGAGGTEACDWASMLLRMYSRWAEDKKFSFKVLNELRGEEAGIKSVTFFIEGIRAYGLLRSERGVHRLVRI